MRSLRTSQPRRLGQNFYSLRHLAELAALLTIALLIITACGPARQTDPQLHQLAADFKAANQATSIQAMLALYHTDGANERTIAQLRGALQYELGLEISSISFAPLQGAPEETIDFVHDGITYGPSLKPGMRMQVAYKSIDEFTSLFTIGKTRSGHWRIICAKPITDRPPTPSHTPIPR